MKGYFANKSQSYFESLRKFWDFYKPIVKTKKSSKQGALSNIMTSDGNMKTSLKDIANVFNFHFSNFQLQDNEDESVCESYVNSRFTDLKLKNLISAKTYFSFTNDVLSKMRVVDQSSSSGNSEIPTRVLKVGASVLCPILTRIFNSCNEQFIVTND